MPAGLLDDREYDEVIFEAQPGDVIVLYSDGITDQPNPEGREYGTGRLARKLQKLCAKPPEMLPIRFWPIWIISSPTCRRTMTRRSSY